MKCTCGGRVDKKYDADVMRCMDCGKSLYAVAGAWQLRAKKAEDEIENAERQMFDVIKENCVEEEDGFCVGDDVVCNFGNCSLIKELHENKEAK